MKFFDHWIPLGVLKALSYLCSIEHETKIMRHKHTRNLKRNIKTFHGRITTGKKKTNKFMGTSAKIVQIHMSNSHLFYLVEVFFSGSSHTHSTHSH